MNEAKSGQHASAGVRRLKAVSVGVLMTLLAAAGTAAMAKPMMGGGGMHGMHGGMGPGMMMFGGSPERMNRMIDHMLDGLNATDAQRSQIKQIAAAAAADLKAQGTSGREMRQRGVQIFTAPNVDANAAEVLRQQMVQQQDQSSRRITQAMVDVSRVLTPEQRARIGEMMKQRQAKMDERMQRMQRNDGGPRGPGGPGEPPRR